MSPVEKRPQIRRSRGGCINCRRAKIKCDEARPFCGTCTRRRHECRGYEKPQSKAAAAKQVSITLPAAAPSGPGPESMSASASHSSAVVSRGLSPIPPGIIPQEDQPVIEVYFDRHPLELTIGPEFASEMNAHTLLMLQNYPATVIDTLYAIGSMYVGGHGQNGALVPAFNRRARMLACLKEKDPVKDIEQMVSMILGMCAMELIDAECHPSQRILPSLINYAAAIISRYARAGLRLSAIAKYYVRGLARQDMILALTNSRRMLIPPSVWINEHHTQHVDRLMGYTVTLIPLMQELCDLAASLREQSLDGQGIVETESESTFYANLAERATYESPVVLDLRRRIAQWKAFPEGMMHIQPAQKFLLQAHAYRAAALLFLFRLFHRPGVSLESDATALSMASEIAYLFCASADDLRLCLWPAFIASCELSADTDREKAVKVFDAIYSSRKTATTLLTKRFCIERVWQRRDAGLNWDWMELALRYPGECIPI